MKTKIAVIFAIIVLIGLGVYLTLKNKAQAPAPTATIQPVQKTEPTKQVETEKAPKEIPNVEGKLRSMNETQIFIELADGKGSAINIEPTVVVKKEGSDEAGNLSLLEVGKYLSVKVDEKNNAKEILIKK